MESLHVIGGHQRSGPDMERAAAGTHDFQARIGRVGRRRELERELLVLAGQSRNRDGLRVAGAGSPDQADHNLRAGIAGEINTAVQALPLTRRNLDC